MLAEPPLFVSEGVGGLGSVKRSVGDIVGRGVRAGVGAPVGMGVGIDDGPLLLLSRACNRARNFINSVKEKPIVGLFSKRFQYR